VESKKKITEHVEELRKRIVIVLCIFSAFFIVGFIFSRAIINALREYLLLSGAGIQLIATHPADVIVAEINIGVFAGIMLSVPVILYEAFIFLKPALTIKEKRIITLSLILGIMLFAAGVIFAYFVLIKVILWFFATLAETAGIANLWNINYFISFVFYTCITIGITFEMPLIVLALVKAGIISRDYLKEKNGAAIILIFVAAAIITPPDPVTQIIVAVPMVALYEIGILASHLFG